VLSKDQKYIQDLNLPEMLNGDEKRNAMRWSLWHMDNKLDQNSKQYTALKAHRKFAASAQKVNFVNLSEVKEEVYKKHWKILKGCTDLVLDIAYQLRVVVRFFVIRLETSGMEAASKLLEVSPIIAAFDFDAVSPSLGSVKKIKEKEIVDTIIECFVDNFTDVRSATINTDFVDGKKDKVKMMKKHFVHELGISIKLLDSIELEDTDQKKRRDELLSNLKGLAGLTSAVPGIHGVKHENVRKLIAKGKEQGETLTHNMGVKTFVDEFWIAAAAEWQRCSVSEVEEEANFNRDLASLEPEGDTFPSMTTVSNVISHLPKYSANFRPEACEPLTDRLSAALQEP
jgi:hypothetical protein